MSPATCTNSKAHRETLQLATFYVGDLCLALEIGQIQEIIRDLHLRQVPFAPPEVSGVINLRGDVTTVIELRRVLGMSAAAAYAGRRTLIVRSQGESLGLIVDRVADITTIDADAILPSPPNVGEADVRLFRGVCARGSEIIVVLDLEAALSSLTVDAQ